MPPIFPQLPHQLGVYNLVELLAEREGSDLYKATQTHVERAVAVEVIRPGATREEEARFLESARLRVAADSLPQVGQVYEFLKADGLWFLTQELPKGFSLAEVAARNGRIAPTVLCGIITAAARIYNLCAQADLKTRATEAADIYLDETGTPHFLSPVTAAEATAATEEAAKTALAQILQAVRPVGVPGENRVLTLLHWMEQGYNGTPLDWPTIAATANAVMQQLAQGEAPEPPAVSDAAIKRRQRKSRRKLLAAAGYAAALVTLIGGGAMLGLAFPQTREAQLPVCRNGAVYCRDGNTTLTVAERCVTKGEYARFLAAWQAANSEERDRMAHGLTEADLTPDAWNNGQPEKASVTGICYAAACAYARYAGAELPTAEQLQAVLAATEHADDLWEFTRCGRSALPQRFRRNIGILMPHRETDPPCNVESATEKHTACTFRISTPSK